MVFEMLSFIVAGVLVCLAERVRAVERAVSLPVHRLNCLCSLVGSEFSPDPGREGSGLVFIDRPSEGDVTISRMLTFVHPRPRARAKHYVSSATSSGTVPRVNRDFGSREYDRPVALSCTWLIS